MIAKTTSPISLSSPPRSLMINGHLGFAMQWLLNLSGLKRCTGVTTQTLTVAATVKSNLSYSIFVEVMEGVYMKVGCGMKRQCSMD
jgi:hypothetical protein